MTFNSTCWKAKVGIVDGEGFQEGETREFSLSPSAPEVLSPDILVITWRATMSKINVLDNEISIYTINGEDYICITDIARYKDPERTDYIVQNWLRNRNTIEFPGIWERLNNPDFNPIEFDGFRKQSGLNSFSLTPKQWIEKTSALGLISKPGRFGGTYAHRDIAYEFASWISRNRWVVSGHNQRESSSV
jgi:hypothetical protein